MDRFELGHARRRAQRVEQRPRPPSGQLEACELADRFRLELESERRAGGGLARIRESDRLVSTPRKITGADIDPCTSGGAAA